MASRLVEAHGLGKNFPQIASSGDRLRALWDLLRHRPITHSHCVLQGIDLRVDRGHSLGIIGENGAGKSTLLKLITRVLRPSAGSVRSNGSIGALLELGAGFHPEYSGRENIALNAALIGLSAREVAAKTPEIIDFADIGEYIDEPIKHYSSGMVVRLGFAIVAATRPDLLITDEVLAVGDESFQKKCISWMENYITSGGTLLMVSHSMYHVQKLCQHAIWLKDGRIQQRGDVFEVTQAYLAYHERLRPDADVWTRPEPSDQSSYRLKEITLRADSGAGAPPAVEHEFSLSGRVYSPDQRMPTVMIGIVRADGTAVYGVSSELESIPLRQIGDHEYTFDLEFFDLPLLPGEYAARVHAMDPEGVRICDTVARDFRIRGQTREIGLCRLPHRWSTADRDPT